MKWLSFLLLFTSVQCFAQIVQPFDLTNVIDGNTVSLNTYASNPAVIIIVSTINCPYTEYYLDRIKNLANSYKSKVPVLLVNSSPEENESPTEMAAFALQHQLSFPYLADKDQKVLANLNPRKSPEAFLLQNSSGKFKVVYRGAIDDNAQSAGHVNHPYLQEAIEKVLASKKIEPADIRPVGCSILNK